MTKKEDKIRWRRTAWDCQHPAIAHGVRRYDELSKEDEESLSGRDLQEELKKFIKLVKHDDDVSAENVRQYGRVNPLIFEWTMEIDRRLKEDDELEKDLPDQNVEREETHKVIKKELENAIGNLEGNTLVLIDRRELEEEHEINSNPARYYEQNMQQQLQRQIGRELKKAFAPKRSRVRPEEDTVSEELDVEPEQKEPSGKYRDVVSQAAEAEIRGAISRLLPVDNYIIAEKIRKEHPEYSEE